MHYITLNEARIMLTKAKWEERAWKRKMSAPPVYISQTKLNSFTLTRIAWEEKVQELIEIQQMNAVHQWLTN